VSAGGSRARLVAELRRLVEECGVAWEEGAGAGETVVTLPGERKLATVVSLTASRQAVQVRAFVMRNPEENHAGVYAFLLRRNLRMPGLAYAIDTSGDIYLVGRLDADRLSAERVDALLGAVLTACDEPFNELLARGFLSSMRAEWAWRTSRGESTANLEAFRHLLDD
jgi:hypothetical protein